MISKCLWVPGVEPGEQALELAAVVAVLELVVAAVVVAAAAVAAAVVVVVVVVAAVACTAAVSRPPGRQCCWWGCAAGWMRRQLHLRSSPALAACFLRAGPERFILNVMGRGRGIENDNKLVW